MRPDIKEMYRFHFHTIDLEKRGIMKYDKNDENTISHWKTLTMFLYDDIYNQEKNK